MGKLSGGERNRVALARLAAADANFLVLDEPTNHLDLWARDALEQALTAFDGSVLFVSHDRYFVNRVADHLIVFEPAGVRVIEGNYEAYQLFLQSKDAAADRRPHNGAPRQVFGVGKITFQGGVAFESEAARNARRTKAELPRRGRTLAAAKRHCPTQQETPFPLSQVIRHRRRNLPAGVADRAD